MGPHQRPKFLERDPRFHLLVSSPVDLDELVRASRIVLDSCGGGTVALRAVGQRALSGSDPDWMRYFGQAGPDMGGGAAGEATADNDRVWFAGHVAPWCGSARTSTSGVVVA